MSEFTEQRHRARERALELLYEQSIKQRSVAEIVNALAVTPDPYTVELLRIVEKDREWAESQLSTHSHDWPLDRMAMVDRLIMTLALCELRLDDSPSRAVVFDEAVEFAKVYSSDASPSFINGLLSACVSSNE